MKSAAADADDAVPPVRRRWHLLRLLLLGIAAVALAVAAGAGGLLWATLPGGDMQADIPGLSAPVDVAIDADGVPRVRAANADDAAAALGFLHARERLFEMDLMRRAAAGELSEIAGPQTLQLDRLTRTLGVRASAESDLAALPAPVRAELDAYARGVNAWIARRGRFSAEEFVLFGTPRPWTPVDSLLWGKTMALFLSGNWRTELAREALSHRLSEDTIDRLWPTGLSGAGHPEARAAFPSAAPALADAALADAALADSAGQLAALLPRFPAPFTLPDEASNEWAVDGAHSATGAPLLAGDPHLSFGLPGIWYLARIDTPGRVLAGATAPGVPFLVIGRNAHVAWTFTTTGTDTQDLFVETPVGTNSYETPQGPAPFAVREERIRVRGQPDVLWTVRSTRHGPVVSDLTNPRGPLLALSMASLMPGDGAAAGLSALNEATDVAAAGRAAAAITSPNQNLLVADRDGIGVFVTGRVPVRRAGDGSRPVPGADGAHDWTGWASGEALPHVVAPASGRLVNANERIAPPGFPVFLGRDWFGDERSRRIRALLDATPRATVADFTRMQTDVRSEIAAGLLPRLRSVTATDPTARAALALLAGWDGTMATDAPQPLIFNAWMRTLDQAMLEAATAGNRGGGAAAPWPTLVRSVLAEGDGAAWCGGDCPAMLAATLQSAVSALASRFGPDPSAWRWGTAHEAVFAHPILRFVPVLGPLVEARIAAPGDDTTVDRGGIAPNGWDAVHGASFRGVYDLADLDRSRFVVAPGQSGHSASRLARNFVRRWRDGDTVALGPAPAAADVTLRLVPAGR